MNKSKHETLGQAIYKDIDKNPYLNELYEDILYNYSLTLFKIFDFAYKEINIRDCLRFADLLSKSVDQNNADKHKIWAQEIVALLNFLYPENEEIKYFMGSVLSNTGNYRGLSIKTPDYNSSNLFELLYRGFHVKHMSIPAAPELQFFRSQKDVYDHLSNPCLSYSGPTSMGKSFIMRMFIKQQIQEGFSMNFALLVPTKALINEVSSKIINDLRKLLAEYNYRLVTSAGSLMLKEKHNFIFILTPERLLYLLISNPSIKIDYLFVDEAHKISSKDSRSAFYYKVVDMLARQVPKPHIIFASPNIPNPEVYLKLIPGVEENKAKFHFTSSFAPVSQVKFIIDYLNKDIQLYNSYSNKFITTSRLGAKETFGDTLVRVGENCQNIVYCSSTIQAIDFALEYAKKCIQKSDDALLTLAKDIKAEVHGDYYLAEIITKGVAYHIGYLPSAIRMRIEDLFRDGLISTMFCTSTLVEGVNLPADNLFITNYKNGRSNMTPVDFKNLIGRVGRIEYNLYGNVYLVRLNDKVKKEQFVKLLQTDVPEQKLSIVTELKKTQKEMIVSYLRQGKIELLKQPSQSANSYALMRKFANILLRDILQDKSSLVRKEFSEYLTTSDILDIKKVFNKNQDRLDDDINVSIDQTENLTAAIAKGLKYPMLNENRNVQYSELISFLERLCRIFKWEKYESQTLGKVGRDGTHGLLKWYAVILSQWIHGTGLSFIIKKAIEYKQKRPKSGVVINWNKIDYDDSLQHRNIVISETLDVIENVILFSFSNYFLRFSTEYKRFHKIDIMQNDWYEYIEYGTTNPLTITLQRSGFSREASTYIKTHKNNYVVLFNDEVKLKRSLLKCSNLGVCKESADIQYNIPELFVD